MRLTVMSFGFKFASRRMRTWCWMSAACPTFYIPELKHKTGLDEEV